MLDEVIEWDIRNWSKAVAFWEENSRINLKQSRALEIGARNGGLSLWLAAKGSQVVCSDFGGPTDAAYKKHRAHGVSDQIQYADDNAMNLPYCEEFDVVIFKSVLGGLIETGGPGSQAEAVKEVYRALKPGGELLFAENLQASSLHKFFRHRKVEWASEWYYPTIGEIVEYLRPFSSFDYRTFGFCGVFGRTESQRKILSLLDTYIFDHISPSKSHYIIAGVARKASQ